MSLTYDQLYKLVDAYKCVEGFDLGKAYRFHDLFFNKHNTISIDYLWGAPSAEDILLEDDQVKYVLHITNFQSVVLGHTEGIDTEYYHFNDLYSKIHDAYRENSDEEGVELVDKFHRGYYTYIGGHYYSYNKTIDSKFEQTINQISDDLKRISNCVELRKDKIVSYLDHSLHGLIMVNFLAKYNMKTRFYNRNEIN